jgi:hypothetical protein
VLLTAPCSAVVSCPATRILLIAGTAGSVMAGLVPENVNPSLHLVGAFLGIAVGNCGFPLAALVKRSSPVGRLGYTPAGQQRRERLRLQAAGRFARGDKTSEIADDLRVTEGSVRRWHIAWRDYRDLIVAAHHSLSAPLVWIWDNLNIHLAPELVSFAVGAVAVSGELGNDRGRFPVSECPQGLDADVAERGERQHRGCRSFIVGELGHREDVVLAERVQMFSDLAAPALDQCAEGLGSLERIAAVLDALVGPVLTA